VAGVDGSVDLQEVALGRTGDVTAAGRDDAGGDGATQAERVADGNHPVAHAHVFAGEVDEGQVGDAIDLDHSQVGALVGADDGGGLFVTVLEDDGHLGGVGYDVVVGDEIAVSRNGKARTGSHELAGRTAVATLATTGA